MVKEGLLNSQAFPICHGHGQSRILKPGTSFHRKMEALTAESLNGLHRHLSQEDGGFDC